VVRAPSPVVIRVEHLSKEYRLGSINHGTLRADLSSWWARVRGREDPNERLDEFGAKSSTVGPFWALQDISFDVRQGEIVGIIGRNGAGKSTLLKILSRVTTPTQGEVRVRGRMASLLEVGTGFHPELSGRENIFLNGAILGMSKAEIRRKFDEIVAFSEVERFIDTPVKRYSSGMYVRLAFAVAAHLDPEILIVDEVLAVGDAEFQRKCLGKMGDVARQGRTVLFVSHNMIAVEHLCSEAILLVGGRIQQKGPTKQVVATYMTTSRQPQTDVADRAGYLYFRSSPPNEDFCITGIQLISRDGRIVREVATWDEVGVRVHFFAARVLQRGSVVLSIATIEGATLILTSTSPDRSLSMKIEEGEGYADCFFDRWPLAAGTFVLGAGLAIPGVEYVCRDDTLCRIEVVRKDVYGSGLAPSTDRYLVAATHSWYLPHAGVPGQRRVGSD
jgi:lipopolysaccharide transport system ATP-binding protein